MNLSIDHFVNINEQGIIRDAVQQHRFHLSEQPSAADVYRMLGYNYPKFFKMDELCKWAWLCAEDLLMSAGHTIYENIDKNKIAVVIATAHGCLEADRKYSETLNGIPSPALFVYTLPNIMLGEICIRHGFKGEQACLVQDKFDAAEIHFFVRDLLENREMDACLCGWADVINGKTEICFFWISKHKGGTLFSPVVLQQLMFK